MFQVVDTKSKKISHCIDGTISPFVMYNDNTQEIRRSKNRGPRLSPSSQNNGKRQANKTVTKTQRSTYITRDNFQRGYCTSEVAEPSNTSEGVDLCKTTKGL